jgi:hypothetical protein
VDTPSETDSFDWTENQFYKGCTKYFNQRVPPVYGEALMDINVFILKMFQIKVKKKINIFDGL